MSVLKSLKGTLASVQNDISSGIRSLGTKKDSADEMLRKTNGVDPDAGGGLLDKFQNTWTELHINSENCASSAETVDVHVTDTFLDLERQNRTANELLETMATLPELCENLEQAVSTLDIVRTEVEQIEQAMLQLQDLVERQELVNNKQQHEQQLSLYKQQKEVTLQLAKVKNARKHADKLQTYESRLQRTLQERQQALQDTYTQEIANYKQNQTTEFKPSSHSSEPGVTLDDVCVDGDTRDLDAFLAGSEENLATIQDGDERNSHTNDAAIKADVGLSTRQTSDVEAEEIETAKSQSVNEASIANTGSDGGESLADSHCTETNVTNRCGSNENIDCGEINIKADEDYSG